MGKATGRAKLFEKFDEHIEKDYDPETEHVVASGSEEGSDDENAGTEHYVTVAKSKLRQKGENSLGPQYRGSKVSRSVLERESSDEEGEDEEEEDDDDEYDDPETANLEIDTVEASDSEIGSDDALGESDSEKLSNFVFRGSSKPRTAKSRRASAADYMSGSEDQDEGSGEELDDDEDEEESDMSDGLEALIDGEAEESDESGEGEDDDDDDDDETNESVNDEEEEDEDEDEEDGEDESSNVKPVMNGRTPNADVEKGAAIQKQRKLYDGLLNLRIRLQKALIAANTFSALEEEPEEEDTTTESYTTAEATALSLLNTLSSLRENCGAATGAGTKRKRDYEVSTTTAEIWEELREQDRRALKSREKCLEKWSHKVQSVNVAAPKGLGSRNKTLVGSLRDQLNDPEHRLAKRTRVPRSCAPAQHAKKVFEDETIFDDADFYQLLLKELVEQRTVDSSANQTSAVPSVVVTASRENRTRKVVDRKASKGRKMRFTVHEKLQNFMAPEDRRQWEQNAIDRFFGTLFGRKLELDEDEAGEDEDMDDVADADFKMFA
ncbi:protein BFR2 [Cordyceps fumosorosea ARSEF 2679]|uniref:Protein BFR2 n=1 Tax=Cordyceps fumosorosea (strain ARSEF 2679) TaxID=1081104 RepID=A0A168BUH6_CORFA|nr:protein BFR2 [Cordyceps fumosorosea ARSEF 2679]OAA70566.1 protein BFR2 [Cordyceps fumosorosea ARSEF 2679]